MTIDQEGISLAEATALRVTGELDMQTAPELEQALDRLIERGGAVLLDVTELRFMDSTGIHVLVRAADALRDRGCLVIHGENEHVRRILDIVGLEAALPNVHRLHDTAPGHAERDGGR